jgi:hypothetical protein
MDELEGISKEQWESAEKALKVTEEQTKKLFYNLILYGTTHPGPVSFDDCLFYHKEVSSSGTSDKVE